MNRMNMAQNKERWWVVVNIIINFRLLKEPEIIVLSGRNLS